MIYKYITEGMSLKDFSNYQNLIDLFKDLRDGNINPKEVVKNQINFKSDVGEIKNGNPNLKSKYQTSAIQNVNILFWLIERSIDFFRDYSYFLPEAKYKGKYGRGLKILTPTQILQRLPIALTPVKTDNTSENLLNEIILIIYSLYWAKEIAKKVNNIMMNSIKL